MKCMYCQGKMEKATAPFSISRKGYHIHWDAIPAYVCSQCGQAYFEAPGLIKFKWLCLLESELISSRWTQLK